MGSGPDDLQHRPSEHVVHDVEELREDIEFEREMLDESIKHDYSTSTTGIVPLTRRRPLWHFAGLWTTFAAGDAAPRSLRGAAWPLALGTARSALVYGSK
jgi:hypothetical protein